MGSRVIRANIARFILDPGPVRGGTTSIKVVYDDVVGPDGQLARFETFTLHRPRHDQAIYVRAHESDYGHQ
jgi:hypothetical protein